MLIIEALCSILTLYCRMVELFLHMEMIGYRFQTLCVYHAWSVGGKGWYVYVCVCVCVFHAWRADASPPLSHMSSYMVCTMTCISVAKELM